MKSKTRLLFSSLITIAFAGQLHAADRTWTSGGDGLWSNNANWGGSAFASGDKAIFGATTSTATLNNDLGTGSPVTLGLAGITFNSDAVAYTIGGNRFSGTPAIVVNSASGVTQTINNNFNLTGVSTITGAGDLTLGGTWARQSGAATLTMNGTGVLTFSSSASINQNNFAFNVNSGTVILESGSVFGRSATVTGGLVKQTAANQIFSNGSSNMPTVNGGTIDLNGFSTRAAIKGTGGEIVNNGASDVTLTLADVNTTASFGGAIKDGTTNNIAVVVATAASSQMFQTLSGTNTYSGGTRITAIAVNSGIATLSISSMANIGTSGSRDLAFGGGVGATNPGAERYLQITGTAISNSDEFDSITFTSGSASGFDIADAGHTYTLSNAVNSGSGGFFKRGAGTLVMTEANTYTGATTIRSGKLTIDSTGTINGTSGVTIGTASTSAAAEFNYNSSTALTQAVSFAAGSTGGTLSGNGTINQAVSVTSGNTLAIGNSVGQMNFGSTLALAGTTIMEIDGTAGAGLTGGNDFANVTGGLTYGGILTLDMGAIFSEGIYSWNLFDFGSETGTFSTVALDGAYTGSLLDGDADGIWNLIDGDNSWVFTESTGVLGLTVIPEPSAALLGSLGMLCLLRRRR
jgi:fibronectin-binding autotransporter adhesin